MYLEVKNIKKSYGKEIAGLIKILRKRVLRDLKDNRHIKLWLKKDFYDKIILFW